MNKDNTDSDTLTIDEVPGQKELTEWQKGELREAGVNLNELDAEDIKAIKLNSDHLDRLKNIRGFVADTEGAIEDALVTDKRDAAQASAQGDDDDDDSSDDDKMKSDFLKPPEIVYNGHAELPTRAEKTPDMEMASNSETTESSANGEKKPEGLCDARTRYENAKGQERTWVDMVLENNNRPRMAKAASF